MGWGGHGAMGSPTFPWLCLWQGEDNSCSVKAVTRTAYSLGTQTVCARRAGSADTVTSLQHQLSFTLSTTKVLPVQGLLPAQTSSHVLH